MEQLDLVETWLANVAISNSDSKSTRELYKSNLQRFCSFIGKTPKQILEDYDKSTDRKFRRRYAQYIQAFGAAQLKKKLTPCTIASRVGAIKSFFKYMDLPLGFVSTPRLRVTYHNRDITHEEINLILDASTPREKAFFAIMAQSGLRPDTICNLKFEHIKEDLTHDRIPCKIKIPQEIAKGKYHSYFTFIGEEAVKYLRTYFNIRPAITNEDYMFLKQGTNEKASPKSISNLFARTVRKLQNKGLMEVKQKGRKKPRDVRLYNLRKWFRKHAHEAGFEFVQFWMGHIVRTGQEEHYRPRDVEFHRKLYAEKAMPFLRLETATPTETEKTIAELRQKLTERDQEINAMKETIAKIQPLVEFVNSFNSPQELKGILGSLKDDSMIQSSHDPKVEFDKSIADKVDEIVKRDGITQAEALRQLAEVEWERIVEDDEKRKRLAKARGLPITREDYEKHLRASIKKLQRRLEKIQKFKD
jgi:integrase